ncbi:MAG: hypothetical protein HY744_30320 [Deltaproteobacteria bacterium]|nr:hypothetical protein [Deltaproteobacteria bacterium]
MQCRQGHVPKGTTTRCWLAIARRQGCVRLARLRAAAGMLALLSAVVSCRPATLAQSAATALSLASHDGLSDGANAGLQGMALLAALPATAAAPLPGSAAVVSAPQPGPPPAGSGGANPGPGISSAGKTGSKGSKEPDKSKVALPKEFKTGPKPEKDVAAVEEDDGLDLTLVSGLGGGLSVAPMDAGIAPLLSYRLWFHRAVGMQLQASAAAASVRTEVGSSPSGAPGTGSELAEAQSVRADLVVGLFGNILRATNSAFFLGVGAGLAAGAGPALLKPERQQLGVGLRAGGGLGVEFSPESVPAVGFTLESGLWLASFRPPELGTVLSPSLTATVQYYLNRE